MTDNGGYAIFLTIAAQFGPRLSLIYLKYRNIFAIFPLQKLKFRDLVFQNTKCKLDGRIFLCLISRIMCT